ncbi:ribonuclease P protein component [Pseudorhodobacter sp. E13]|uniref:ribonuclease P protein component n=1 Tax=Pseudorhodobacter sp. E13 TaxID=2487931 RepID=UPI000F8F57A7|nr:ribonuclease P protein component [Pseudorhodobacter sp. E13]RUS58601.1 ribonuclease P protein component [Pseudorhodobacter sp. E13]
MTPPKAEGKGSLATPEAPSAVSLCAGVAKPEVMRNRSDFLRAASAQRQGTQGFMLQARARGDDTAVIRVGFTCSKKIGNAVARNRAKRRLRAVAQAVLPQAARPGWDYVLVGRPSATIERDFALLISDLQNALDRVHANAGGPRK